MTFGLSDPAPRQEEQCLETCAPLDERQRLEALSAYAILDTPREPAFDDIVRLAADIFEAPIAVVNLIADGRQWFKAEVGIGSDELPLDVSICAHAILQRGIVVVPDLRADERFKCNPLVTAEPGLRFYAAAVLETPAGVPIGTVCVLDTRPRAQGITDRQRLTLEVLARQVMSQLELRRAVAQRDAEVALARASEHRLRLVVDSARDYAIITMDADRRVTDWSKGAEAIFGRPSAEMIGKSGDEIFTPEDRADRQPEQEVATATGEGQALDQRWHQRADGSRVFLNGSVHPLPRDETGRERGFLKIARDETAQRAARAALAESESRFRNMADNAPVMMWVSDQSGFCLHLNRRWHEFTGQTEAEAEGYGWLDVSHPDDKARAGRAFVDANAAQTDLRVEYRLRAADGSYRWAFHAASPRFGENGEFLGYVGSVIDIDERRQAEQRLLESEEQLRLATEAAEIGLWDFDVATGTLFWQPRVRAMFGVSSDVSISAQDFIAGLHAEDAASTMAAFALALDPATRALYDVEYRTIGRDDGLVRWIAAKGRGIFDANDTCSRVIGTVIDVTARKAIEAELLTLNETLERRVLEEVAERAKTEEQLRQAQKMEVVGQLTGGIAHDFNNLLTGIIGSLDMMQRKIAAGRSGETERYISVALTSANRAAALTHRLLAFSRRQPLDPRPVDANRLVTSTEDLLRRTLGEKIRLEMVTAGGLWQTLCDPHQLESAILNLAINARDAMPDGGQLTIETCNAHLDSRYAASTRDVRPGQYVCICVSDTGTGMSSETIEKAFEPFFTTKPIGQGTGLGLSMIYGFARQSDGYAKIYSEVGQGTTVKIYLPRFHGRVEDVEPSDQVPAAALATQHAEIVLVVEDETAVRDLVVEVLSDLGYRTLEAVDGQSGLAILHSSQPIDLLVTDVGLPGMNGRQMAEAARLQRPGLKILFMTGYAENAAVSGGFLEPGMELLTKPFAVDALAQRLSEILKN